MSFGSMYGPSLGHHIVHGGHHDAHISLAPTTLATQLLRFREKYMEVQHRTAQLEIVFQDEIVFHNPAGLDEAGEGDRAGLAPGWPPLRWQL